MVQKIEVQDTRHVFLPHELVEAFLIKNEWKQRWPDGCFMKGNVVVDIKTDLQHAINQIAELEKISTGRLADEILK